MPSKKIKKRFIKRNKTRSKNKNKITIRRNKKITRGGENGDFEYMANLDSQEIDILRKYTERHDLYSILLRSDKNYKTLYDEMNNQEIYDIDDKINKLNELVKNINTIDNIMSNKSPVTNEDIIVYRGTKNHVNDEPYLGINKAYISTSRSLNAIEKNTWRFLEHDCCLYKITIKKGVPYINLSKISYFGEQHRENQEEILLPRGLKTSLESVSETDIQGDIYKTYNVIIELNNQDKYSVEPIQNLPPMIELYKIFEMVRILFDIASYMNSITKNPDLTTENREKIVSILGEDDFDFYTVNMETIDDLLIQKYSFSITLVDYNNYLKDIMKSMIANKVFTVENNDKLVGFINKLQQYVVSP
jgi:hypothetical protein